MTRAENKMPRRFPLNAVRICIDSTKDKELSGRIYSEMSAQPLIFHNCIELFLSTDRLFEERGFPQAFQKKRSFSAPQPHVGYRPPQPADHPGEINIAEQWGECETCDVIVQTRKRSGWQGLIKDLKEQTTMQFQSEMELLDYLLQNYMTFPAA